MHALLTSFAALWPRIPRPIRYLLLLVLCVSALAFGTTAAFLAWRSGHIAQVLGTTAQRQDITQQTDTMRAMATTIAEQAAASAMWQVSGDIRDHIAEERKAAEDTILRPMLKVIYGLDRRLQRIEQAQKLTDDRVTALPVEFDEKLRRIMEEAPPPSTDILLQEVLDRIHQQSERLDRIEKARVSKARF